MKVLGCLRNRQITVIVLPGNGFVDRGLLEELPVSMIPFDLRMPNSEFDILLNRTTGCFTQVLRKGEIFSHTN